jgi:hypothetical protein
VSKLPHVLAAALLLLPTVALNAASLPSVETRPGLDSPRPAGGMCWIFVGGRWWYVPC